MKRTVTKLVSCILSIALVLSCGVTAFAAGSGYFIDTMPEGGGEKELTVANFGDGEKTFRLYAAEFNGDELIVTKSASATLGKDESAVLATDVAATSPNNNVRYFIWDGNLKPYDPYDSEPLPVPDAVSGPNRANPDEHRTKAYHSFTLKWTPDATGVVDHYEVWEKDGKEAIGTTKQGFYTIANDEINPADQQYYVVAVSKAGKRMVSDVSNATGPLYMNQIDFSNMTGITAETDTSVTYNNFNNETHTSDAPKYATDEDDNSAAAWVNKDTNAGIKQVGMELYAGDLGTEQYVRPAILAANDDKGREQRGAYKTYYSQAGATAGKNNFVYFTIDDSYLTAKKGTENEAVISNVTIEYDYLDNVPGITGRFKAPNTNGNAGTDFSGRTDTVFTYNWVTSSKAVTNFALHSTEWASVGGRQANMRLQMNAPSTSSATNPKLYISGARVYLTGRDGTYTEENPLKQYVYQNYAENRSEGLTMGKYASSGTVDEAPYGKAHYTSTQADARIGVAIDDDYIATDRQEVLTVALSYVYIPTDENDNYDNKFSVMRRQNVNGTSAAYESTITAEKGWKDGIEGQYRRAIVQMPADFVANNTIFNGNGTYDFAIGLSDGTKGILYINNIEAYNTTAEYIR